MVGRGVSSSATGRAPCLRLPCGRADAEKSGAPGARAEGDSGPPSPGPAALRWSCGPGDALPRGSWRGKRRPERPIPPQAWGGGPARDRGAAGKLLLFLCGRSFSASPPPGCGPDPECEYSLPLLPDPSPRHIPVCVDSVARMVRFSLCLLTPAGLHLSRCPGRWRLWGCGLEDTLRKTFTRKISLPFRKRWNSDSSEMLRINLASC